jgi:hypothetical protein
MKMLANDLVQRARETRLVLHFGRHWSRAADHRRLIWLMKCQRGKAVFSAIVHRSNSPRKAARR